MSDDLNKALSELSEEMHKERLQYEKANDAWWNSLTEKEREDAFYAVVSRIRTAELKEQRSYRGAIYGVFGFDVGMYARGMDCGYLDIHNAIVDGNEFMDISTATDLEVVDAPSNSSVAWNNINGISITTDNRHVKIELNNGNPYV